MKEYLYQFIPRRFQYLTQTKKITYKEKSLKTDYIINLIHEFIIKYYFSNDIQSLKVNLYSLILRKKYGMDYNYYINYLMDNNFIKMTSNYYVGKKAKTFQIDYFDVGELIRVRIYDKILLKKHSKNFLENSITEYNNSPIPLDIRKKLVNDIYSVTIDYDKSLKYLDDLKEKKLIDDNKYFKNFISINGIKDNHLFFKFDSYGRFHTNFTILKRQIRHEYLKISGDDVCEIDIKNSQPFFLSYLMKKYKADWNEFQDVEKYFFIVNNGLIYDDIVERYTDIKNRDEAKEIVYKVLFGKNGDSKKSSKIFKELYPNVYKFIENYKEIKGDYKVMSHELQMIESEFIFNNVIKKIIKKNPKIKIITIHDSIIYPCLYDKIVKKIFNEELIKLKK
jgi:hypothetical protein